MRSALQFFVPLALLGIFPVLIVRGLHLRLNDTNSVPTGIYRDTDRAGAYVGFCLPLDTLRAAQDAGLTVGSGDCPGNVRPILKRVFRVSADRPLTLDTRGFTLDGVLLPNTAPKTYSRTGAQLVHYPFGIYDSGLWAISSYNADSFDSRYFGPLDADSVRFRAVPVCFF